MLVYRVVWRAHWWAVGRDVEITGEFESSSPSGLASKIAAQVMAKAPPQGELTWDEPFFELQYSVARLETVADSMYDPIKVEYGLDDQMVDSHNPVDGMPKEEPKS